MHLRRGSSQLHFMCIFHANPGEARRGQGPPTPPVPLTARFAAHDEFIKYLALLMISELQASRVGLGVGRPLWQRQRTQQVQCNNLAATYDSAAIANKVKWRPRQLILISPASSLQASKLQCGAREFMRLFGRDDVVVVIVVVVGAVAAAFVRT